MYIFDIFRRLDFWKIADFRSGSSVGRAVAF